MYKKIILTVLVLCVLACASAYAEKSLPTAHSSLFYTGTEQQLLTNLGKADDGYEWQYFFYGTAAEPYTYFPSRDIPVGNAVDKYQVHCFYVPEGAGLTETIGTKPEVSYEVTILPTVTTTPVAKTGLLANRSNQNLLSSKGEFIGKRDGGGGGMEFSVTDIKATSPGSWKGSAEASLEGEYKIWYRASAEGPARPGYASHWFTSKPAYITASIGPEPTYSVDIGIVGEGSVTPSKNSALWEESVSLTVTPKPGYRLKSMTAEAANGDEIQIVDNIFEMPASNVIVTAEFERIPVALKEFAASAIKGDRFSLVPHFVVEAFDEISYVSDALDSDTVRVDLRTGVISVLNGDAETVVITMYAEDVPAIRATIRANEGLAVAEIANQTELIKEEAFAGSAVESVDMRGCPGIGIGKDAFRDCADLVRVVLPEAVSFESDSIFVFGDGKPLSGATIFCSDMDQAEWAQQNGLNCVLIEE